ncbi:hypothetical protein EIP86_001665 [Pleurotus ostreatoroseus]|nr:hypothetical protein EIP86_001665 [Pleurotus ostreatoroseus]
MDFEFPYVSSPTEVQEGIARDLAQQRQALAVAMAEIQRLKTYWNTTSLVSRLPPELLVRIFVTYATLVKDEYYQYRSILGPITCHDRIVVKPYSWIRVTHVCRQWRDVALQHPILWSWIVEAPGDWVKTMLGRCGQAGLTVDTQPASLFWRVNEQYWKLNWRSLSALQAIYNHWNHIEEAKVMLGTGHPRLWDVEAPLLCSLDVASTLPEGGEKHQLLFKAGGTPSLKELIWSNSLQWSLISPLLNPQLEVLKVQTRKPTSPISTAMWFSALRNMPCLRSLSLRSVVGGGFSHSSDPQSLSLPHLRNLELGTMPSHISGPSLPCGGEASVFAAMNTPDNVKVAYKIKCGLSDECLDSIAATLSSLAARKRVRSMNLRCIDGDVDWTFSRSSTPKKEPTEGEDDMFVRIWSWPADPFRISERLSSSIVVPDTLSMRVEVQSYNHDVIRMQPHGNIPSTKRTLANALRGGPNVRTLVIVGDQSLETLPTALTTQSAMSSSQSSAASRFVMPGLQDLTLERALWKEKGRVNERPNAPSSFVNALVKSLAARREKGSKLATLRIRQGSAITQADVDYIKRSQCVDLVDWDGGSNTALR